ncbi:UbiA prenyltransferase family protein [candidate division KSB1 bacterium]|nr:UbiA prenyltransferase family protein [candidate division KSB1 bacterium]
MYPLKAYLQTFLIMSKSRAEALFAWTWNTIAGVLVGSRHGLLVSEACLAIGSMFFLTFAVYVYNDLLDAHYDKSSLYKGDRPIPRKQVQPQIVKQLFYITSFIGIMGMVFVNLTSLLFAVSYYLLFWVYSWRRIYLKKRFILKELSIALAILPTGLTGYSVSQGPITADIWALYGVICLFAFLAQPSVNDSSDIKEDREAGIQTMAIRFSGKTKIQLLILATALVVLALPLFSFYWHYTSIAVWFAVCSTLIFLGLILSHKKQIEAYPVKWKFYTHGFYFIIQLGLIIGSMRLD